MRDLDRKISDSSFYYLYGFSILSYIGHIFLDISFIPAAFFNPSTVPEEVPFLSFKVIAAVQLAFSMFLLIVILLRQALSWFGVWKGDVIEEWDFFWATMVLFVSALLFSIVSALIPHVPSGFNLRFHMIVFGASFMGSSFTFTCIVMLKYQGDINHNSRENKAKEQKRHTNL